MKILDTARAILQKFLSTLMTGFVTSGSSSANAQTRKRANAQARSAERSGILTAAAASRPVAIFRHLAEPRRQTVEPDCQLAELRCQTARLRGHLAERFSQTVKLFCRLAELLCQAKNLKKPLFFDNCTPFPSPGLRPPSPIGWERDGVRAAISFPTPNS